MCPYLASVHTTQLPISVGIRLCIESVYIRHLSIPGICKYLVSVHLFNTWYLSIFGICSYLAAGSCPYLASVCTPHMYIPSICPYRTSAHTGHLPIPDICPYLTSIHTWHLSIPGSYLSLFLLHDVRHFLALVWSTHKWNFNGTWEWQFYGHFKNISWPYLVIFWIVVIICQIIRQQAQNLCIDASVEQR